MGTGAPTRTWSVVTRGMLIPAALSVAERAVGPAHPVVLMIRNDLAVSTAEVHGHEAAVELHEADLRSRLRRLGPDHPDTL
ncbi:tetratricopeptide repeat protein [Dactylosporangium siamense]|uniref:Tetratricopeptide repeat protein n=1 Tax=Dactylosporangium siamense TaxID=685454 RepID=A0A919PWS7_9ACTN|nr:tetratricopeptide repeat protein [Dactylosporangium siamense]GIG49923.1 hypothetical protein Dsi01nite_079640 [Dactylosporangium siamense]